MGWERVGRGMVEPGDGGGETQEDRGEKKGCAIRCEMAHASHKEDCEGTRSEGKKQATHQGEE